MAEPDLEVIIVTGKINSGKSTAMVKLVEHERSKGISPTGIIALSVFEKGVKTGFDIIDIASGQKMPLARIDWQIPDSFTIGKYTFSNEGFSFARRALLNFKQSEVVFLDEVGPFELEGHGHYDCLKLLLNSNISRMYIAVRHECLEEFEDKFLADIKTRIINIDNP